MDDVCVLGYSGKEYWEKSLKDLQNSRTYPNPRL